MKLEFFDRLRGDSEFCAYLGKMTLAGGRFESGLRTYIRLRGVEVSDHSTLGQLVSILQKHKLISANGEVALRSLTRQRNYLTHSLFDLFSERVGETLLPREDLVPEDISVFTEKVRQLEEDLSGLTQLVERRILEIHDTAGLRQHEDLLFRP